MFTIISTLFILIFGVTFFFIIRQFMTIGSVQKSIFKNVQKQMDLHHRKQEMELRKHADYRCNYCSAVLEDPEDISPAGDVKCQHCDQWYNIYN